MGRAHLWRQKRNTFRVFQRPMFHLFPFLDVWTPFITSLSLIFHFSPQGVLAISERCPKSDWDLSDFGLKILEGCIS